jgi:nucleotide-binding universal stress UspA family protein
MFRHLLVPLDGTPQAAIALPLARTLATETGAAITLVYVAPDNSSPADRRADMSMRERLRELTNELTTAGLQATAAVRSGPVASEIAEVVRTRECDLVVMGTHGRVGLERILHGSVAGDVLSTSGVPTLLVRPGGQETTRLATLLVPVDESPEGQLALGAATRLAERAGARVTLVEAIPPLPASMASIPVDPGWEAAALSRAQAFLGDVTARLVGRGIATEAVVRSGEIPRTIVSVADEVAADLIVMSTRALGGPDRALLGTVADEVVRTANRPVLLVRRDPPGA